MAEHTPQTHVHDCTGPDQTCACGFVFRIPRFCVSVEVFDGRTIIVNRGHNCNSLSAVIRIFEEEIAKLTRLQREAEGA